MGEVAWAKLPKPHLTPPRPPSLHWLLVLVLGFFTSGLFTLFWLIRLARFTRKLDAGCKAMSFLWTAGGVLAAASLLAGVDAVHSNSVLSHLADMTLFTSWVLFEVSIFSLRSTLLRYYNTVQPIGLRLSGTMTVLFHVVYLQYHLCGIARTKPIA